MEFISFKEMADLRLKGAAVINVCGVEFYRLELERMWENNYRYILKYRDVIRICFSPNVRDNFYGQVIRKLDEPWTQAGRYIPATAKDVNRAVGYDLLVED